MTRYQLLQKGVRDLDLGADVPPDQSSAAWQEYRQWLKAGNTPLPIAVPVPVPPTADEVRAMITLATQARLDDFARTRNYDGILSACSYDSSAVPQFAAEGACCVTGRDATWAALYAVLAEVLAGTRPMPESFADVETLLPALEWPT